MDQDMNVARMRQAIGPRGLRLSRSTTGLLLLAPIILLLGVFFLYPLVRTVLFKSLTDPHKGLGNYSALFRSIAFRNILKITFQIAAYTTVVCLFLGYPFAYLLSRMRKTWARFFLALSLLPFWTALLARLYAWMALLGRRGIINTWLKRLNLRDQPADLLYNRRAVIIGMVHILLPLMILILYSSMASIDRELQEAARSLGASETQAFRKVFLPLSMHGVYAGSLLVFIISLGFFVTPALLGGPGDVTIATYVQEEVNILRYGIAGAMSILLLIVTVLLFVVFTRLVRGDELVRGALRQ
jgi:putative spermidine/putrescine transport system permease protein